MRKRVNNFFTGVVLAFCLLLCSVCTHAQKQGQALIDSLRGRLAAMQDDTAKVKILNAICYNYFFVNASDGIQYGRQALALATRLKWDKGIATAHKNIGNAYMNKSVYDTALEEYALAQSMYERLKDSDGIARVLGNIGSIYDDLGNYVKSLEYAFKALAICEGRGDYVGQGRIYSNIGNLYMLPARYSDALRYHTLALAVHRKLGDRQSMAVDLGNIGNAYNNLKEYNKALAYDDSALAIYNQLGDSSAIANKLQNISEVFGAKGELQKSLDYAFHALAIYQRSEDKDGLGTILGHIGDIYNTMAEKMAKDYGAMSPQARKYLQTAKDYYRRAITVFIAIGELNQLQYTYSALSKALEMDGDYKDALEMHKLFSRTRDSVASASKNVQFANLEKERALSERKHADDERLAQVHINELMRAKKRNEAFLFSACIVALVGGIVVVIHQRKKTEMLLLNILPVQIAERLKRKEHPIADFFYDASILFIDMVGFTTYSADKDPKDLLYLLNDVFTRFDAIADRYGLEKIKTIGDCYMAVAGLPNRNENHPQMAANMALDIRESMKNYRAADGTPIRFRIGVDCGPVVAGVIGQKKFIYDIWGDAVNMASRMESSGLPGEIHCTDNFRNRLPQKYTFINRGEVEVKSRGLMHTWILTGKDADA